MAAEHLLQVFYYYIFDIFSTYLTRFTVKIKDKFREYSYTCYNSSKEYFKEFFMKYVCRWVLIGYCRCACTHFTVYIKDYYRKYCYTS